MRRLALNSGVLTLGTYVSNGASAVTYLLAARSLGPTLFGSLAGAIGIAIVIASFADFGINVWTTRALAQSPQSIGVFQETLSAKLTLAALLAAAWVIVVVAIASGPLKLAIALLGAYILSVVVAGTLTVPFRASERMIAVSTVMAVEKLVALGVWVIVAASGRLRPEALPIALAMGGAASAICAGVLLPRHFVGFRTPSIRRMVELWRSSFNFGMVGASNQLLRVDVAIVGAVSGPFAAGIYAAPARLTTFLSVIPGAFTTAVFPRMVRSISNRTSHLQEAIGAAVMLLLMVFLLGGFAVVAPVVVPFALGPEYLSSVGVLRIFLLIALVSSANLPLLALLQAANFERYAARSVIVSAAIGLSAVGVGAHVAGASGAAFGVLAMQLMQLALFAFKALRMHSSVGASSAASIPVNGHHDAAVVQFDTGSHLSEP